MTEQIYLTAIVIGRGLAQNTLERALKFRHVNRNKLDRFEKFIREKHPGAEWINYYDALSREFVKRNYLVT